MVKIMMFKLFFGLVKTIYDGLRNLGRKKPIDHGMNFNPTRKRHNYVGHTPIENIATIGDITFLDTFESDTMSMIEVVSQKHYTVKVWD